MTRPFSMKRSLAALTSLAAVGVLSACVVVPVPHARVRGPVVVQPGYGYDAPPPRWEHRRDRRDDRREDRRGDRY